MYVDIWGRIKAVGAWMLRRVHLFVLAPLWALCCRVFPWSPKLVEWGWPPIAKVGRFSWDVIDEFFDDGCPEMAAAMAYYIAFSLPSLLLISIDLAALFFGQEAATGQVSEQMVQLLGAEVATQVEGMIRYMSEHSGSGWAASTLGLTTLLFAATGGFAQIQTALNKAWEVQPDPDGHAVRVFFFKRLLSFSIVVSVGALLVASLITTSLISAFGGFLSAWFGWDLTSGALTFYNALSSFLLFTLLFAVMFKILPDAVIAWRDVWMGAIVTAVFFVIGKSLVALYLSSSAVVSAAGAASSLAVLFIWIYYSALMLLFGAEFTQVWAHREGRMIRPGRGAVWMPKGRAREVALGETSFAVPEITAERCEELPQRAALDNACSPQREDDA